MLDFSIKAWVRMLNFGQMPATQVQPGLVQFG